MKLITIALAVCVVALTIPAVAKECRMPSALRNPHERPSIDCGIVRDGTKPGHVDERVLKSRNGFIDLGNGTQVKISGRIRGEMIYKR